MSGIRLVSVPAMDHRGRYGRIVGMRTAPDGLYLLTVPTTHQDSGPMPAGGRAYSIRWVDVEGEAARIERPQAAPAPTMPAWTPADRWVLRIMGWTPCLVVIGVWLWALYSFAQSAVGGAQ